MKYKHVQKKIFTKGIGTALMQLDQGNNCNEFELQNNILGLCLTQMHATKGIELLGDRAIVAIEKEYAQLDDLQVFEPIDAKKSSAEQKKNALRTIDLIKLKRDKSVKGRTVADGSKQRKDLSKEDTSSPAVHFDSFLASLAIDSLEDRDVATADVAGAYLKASMPDFVMLRVTGGSVDALLNVNNKKYQPYVVYEKNRKVLYLKLRKAMYGCLKAALLWYELFSNTLKEEGFKLNPYEPCVANKMVKGKQLTVVWYVDDLKVSHVSSEVVDETLEFLELKFGKMKIKRGRLHEYLGIDVELKDRKVYLCMKEYLIEAIKDFGEAINCSAKTPATKSLMEIPDKEEKLGDEQRSRFHSIVQKLLYV